MSNSRVPSQEPPIYAEDQDSDRAPEGDRPKHLSIGSGVQRWLGEDRFKAVNDDPNPHQTIIDSRRTLLTGRGMIPAYHDAQRLTIMASGKDPDDGLEGNHILSRSLQQNGTIMTSSPKSNSMSPEEETLRRIGQIDGSADLGKHESGEYGVPLLVEDVRQSVGSVVMPRRELNLLADSNPPEYSDGVIEQMILDEVRELLSHNSLEDERKAMSLLSDSGLIAAKRWEGIYQSQETDMASTKRHKFANKTPESHNALAERVVEMANLKSGSLMLELGPGYGNDLIYVAQRTDAMLIGIDSSAYAVEQIMQNVDAVQTKGGRSRRKGAEILNRRIDGQISLSVADFLEQLKVMQRAKQGARFDAISSHSTIHYNPPNILREEIFPLIASRLKDDGLFFMIMKLASSASAQSENQTRLVTDPGNPVSYFNPSIDTIDRMFRVYPSTQENVLTLTEPSFETVSSRMVYLNDYEEEGKIECAVEFIGRPKR